MINLLIRFLRDVARQRYESFIVASDEADIDFSNLNATIEDYQLGFFWDKQFEIAQDLNNISVGFPCLAVERSKRTHSENNSYKDEIFILLAISKHHNKDAYNDKSENFIFSELSALLLTINELCLFWDSSTNQQVLLLESQKNSQQTLLKAFVFDGIAEEVEIIPTQIGNNELKAASFAISLKGCASKLSGLTQLPPLVTDLLPQTSCC